MEPAGTVAHPLVDDVRSGVVLSRSATPIVALGPLRADLIRSCTAARTALVLVTAAGSRLTRPLAAVLAEAGTGWAVERESSGWYEGRSGRLLTAPERALDPAGPDDPVAPEFLRTGIGTVPHLAVTVSTRHRAEGGTLLGGAVEALAAATRGTPAGWGPHEPVEQPWDPASLTAFASAASPDEVRLQVVGHGRRPFAGALLARRTGRGVEEITELVLGIGPTLADATPAVMGALAGLARAGMPLFALAVRRSGEPDLTVRPVLQGGANPEAVLIGAPAVRELGIDAAALAGRFEGTVVGRRRLPGLLVPLGGDRGGWLALAALMEEIGFDRLRRVTGAPPIPEVTDAP